MNSLSYFADLLQRYEGSYVDIERGRERGREDIQVEVMKTKRKKTKRKSIESSWCQCKQEEMITKMFWI